MLTCSRNVRIVQKLEKSCSCSVDFPLRLSNPPHPLLDVSVAPNVARASQIGPGVLEVLRCGLILSRRCSILTSRYYQQNDEKVIVSGIDEVLPTTHIQKREESPVSPGEVDPSEVCPLEPF